jgi:hypothetical protein
MMIDTSGKWWRGQDFSDLAEYIRRFTEDGYPAGRIVQSVCRCGHMQFRLRADADEGCAQRTCAACGEKAFICDSDEYWVEARPRKVRCPCKGDVYVVGVRFSLRDGGSIRSVTVGERCVACGILGSCAEWKIDYEPTDRLFTLV